MKVVFFGTPDFAAKILEDLIGDPFFEVVGIVTQPDKAQGRSKQLLAPPVKEVAAKLLPHVPCFQPLKASSAESVSQLAALNPELFIVVAYGQLLKQNLLDVPKHGVINVHGSILPTLRGAAPIQYALINGETSTGVTIMKMALEMDAGPILATASIEIPPDMTYGELRDQLCHLSQPLLRDTVRGWLAGKIIPQEQDPRMVTFAHKITLDDTYIDWNRSAAEIHNLVRGTNPEPGAWCKIRLRGKEEKLRILKTRLYDESNHTPGQILQWGKSGIIIACKKGSLELLEVQIPGKSIVTAKAFACGYPVQAVNTHST